MGESPLSGNLFERRDFTPGASGREEKSRASPTKLKPGFSVDV
jgi:hypothetical protein